jgi:hypothetical protein
MRVAGTAKEMDELLGMTGKRIPVGPKTTGRGKVTWEPNQHTKITFEQHPYDKGSPIEHAGPHWHLDTPGSDHVRHLPGGRIPGH